MVDEILHPRPGSASPKTSPPAGCRGANWRRRFWPASGDTRSRTESAMFPWSAGPLHCSGSPTTRRCRATTDGRMKCAALRRWPCAWHTRRCLASPVVRQAQVLARRRQTAAFGPGGGIALRDLKPPRECCVNQPPVPQSGFHGQAETLRWCFRLPCRHIPN